MKKQEEGKVDIHGKTYLTVAYRVNLFRGSHSEDEWGITTDIVENTPNRVVVKAGIHHNGVLLATGHGEEFRGTSQINKTSALENAETSAIGRALASLGYGGTEFASANEVQQAIHQQEQPFTPDQKLVFDELIAADESFEFWVWFHAQTDEAKRGLMNSFERGTITKMKDKVRQMETDGSARFKQYLEMVTQLVDEGDANGVEEIWHEAGEDACKLMWKELNGEYRQFIKEIFK